MKDQSAIKGNLNKKNAFLVAKQGLMEIRPNKTNYGLSFGHFRRKNVKKRGEEKKKKKKKKKKRKGIELGLCMEYYGCLDTCSNFLWVLYGF